MLMSPSAWACAAKVNARCACRSNVEAECSVPLAPRSRPARSATDCASSEPDCSRSCAALACKVVAAATTPCNAILRWLPKTTPAASLPSWPLLRKSPASICSPLRATTLPALSNVPATVADSVLPEPTVPFWIKESTLICNALAAYMLPAFSSVPPIRNCASAPDENAAPCALRRLAASTCSGPAATTLALLSSAPAAVKVVLPALCTVPSNASAPTLAMRRSPPVSIRP